MALVRREPVLPVEAVNFHVWLPCNMRCRFCFGRFEDVRSTVLPAGHLRRDDAVAVVSSLGDAGFSKITFAGGEPLLCPWVADLLDTAKSRGMITSIVTNGSLLTTRRLTLLVDRLDWLTISVDSDQTQTLILSGRTAGRRVLTSADYIAIASAARSAGLRLKVNTVVSRFNESEDLSALISSLRPERWKIFQVLRIEQQNGTTFDACAISTEQFRAFVDRHKHLQSKGVTIVPEANEQMIGAYAMVDPAGRFFDNIGGVYHYSSPILEVGVLSALDEVEVSRQAFISRGGLYKWN